MKGKLAIVFSSALLLIAAVLIVSAVYQEEAIFPGSSGEFEIQGLTWRSIAYYYHPGIYEDLYNEEDNLRLIYKAKDVGANYLMVRAFYNCAEDGSLIGDDEAAETCLSQAIATAHDYDISIFLTPFVESMEFWPERNWQLSVEDWTEAVLRTATRAGVLACGHPHIAGDVLERYPLYGPLDLREQQETVALFSMSEQYTELRRRLGVVLSQPPDTDQSTK